MYAPTKKNRNHAGIVASNKNFDGRKRNYLSLAFDLIKGYIHKKKSNIINYIKI